MSIKRIMPLFYPSIIRTGNTNTMDNNLKISIIFLSYNSVCLFAHYATMTYLNENLIFEEHVYLFKVIFSFYIVQT